VTHVFSSLNACGGRLVPDKRTRALIVAWYLAVLCHAANNVAYYNVAYTVWRRQDLAREGAQSDIGITLSHIRILTQNKATLCYKRIRHTIFVFFQ